MSFFAFDLTEYFWVQCYGADGLIFALQMDLMTRPRTYTRSDGTVHCIVGCDEYSGVEKLQKNECSNDVPPGWGLQIDLE